MSTMDEQTAKQLCEEIRKNKLAKGIWKSQCFFCKLFAKNNPTNYCYHNPPDFDGCNIVNKIAKKRGIVLV